MKNNNNKIVYYTSQSLGLRVMNILPAEEGFLSSLVNSFREFQVLVLQLPPEHRLEFFDCWKLFHSNEESIHIRRDLLESPLVVDQV